ncbi:MAG: ribonuclease III [Candidatus Gracilibacteria bacterium]|jgi:ribonuclease-3
MLQKKPKLKADSIYSEVEKKIGVIFKDKKLLENAFIHKSYINEHRNEGIESNERLEFLGDAVLELVATKRLFAKYPNQQEGKMTSYRSALVKGKQLAVVSRELDLGKYLNLSNGEEKSLGREKGYILANTLEALIGAIYISNGYIQAEKFIEKFILTALDEIVEKGLYIDSKSQFQEACQDKGGITPHYEVLEESGPDHEKNFVVGAYIDKLMIAKGEGKSKQKAEQSAAENALIAKGWL